MDNESVLLILSKLDNLNSNVNNLNVNVNYLLDDNKKINTNITNINSNINYLLDDNKKLNTNINSLAADLHYNRELIKENDKIYNNQNKLILKELNIKENNSIFKNIKFFKFFLSFIIIIKYIYTYLIRYISILNKSRVFYSVKR